MSVHHSCPKRRTDTGFPRPRISGPSRRNRTCIFGRYYTDTVREEIRCQFVVVSRKDELTPDFRGRESAAPRPATELVLFATITRTRCVTIGSRVRLSWRRHSRWPPAARSRSAKGKSQPAGASARNISSCRPIIGTTMERRKASNSSSSILRADRISLSVVSRRSSGNGARLKQSWLIVNALFNWSSEPSV